MTEPATAADPITLTVHGTPQPQGSKTAYVRGGRAILTEGKGPGRANHAAWRQAIATAARDWQAINERPLLDGPLAVSITFLMPRPPSIPRKRQHPDRKPDIDKLVRSVFDAISGLVIVDDARVVHLTASKVYAVDGPPGCVIEIREAA